jgi:type III pantothenate kinase
MRLLVDVGNTALKVAREVNGQITFIEEDDINWPAVKEIAIAQVGPDKLLENIKSKSEQLAIPLLQARVTAQLGAVKCAYPQFQNLGIDRWLGVVACHYLYPNKHCVVVDSGTASKVDVVTKSGEHIGGWILPGLDMMIESLVSNTQKVFSDSESLFLPDLGRNTPNAVKNGALIATLGAVEAGIAQLKSDFDDIQVIFAGGYGELLQLHFEKPSIYVDDLVLKGLRNWCEFIHK